MHSDDRYRDLTMCTFDTVPSFTLPAGWCKVIDVYDCDTCRIAMYVGNEIYQFVVRLQMVDSPEIRPRKSTNANLERRAARIARTRMIELCVGESGLSHEPRKKTRRRCGVSRQLVRLEPAGMDKYGRVLGKLYMNDDPRSINEILLDEGYVRPYNGGVRHLWTPEELNAIVAIRQS